MVTQKTKHQCEVSRMFFQVSQRVGEHAHREGKAKRGSSVHPIWLGEGKQVCCLHRLEGS
jgi:hypothetical protein